MNMYKVIAKCGHVGKGKYIPITFAINANDGKEAARIARNIPRVKHNKKDAIINVIKIDLEEYLSLKEKNANDPYLTCKNKQEQNCFDLEERIIHEESYKVEKLVEEPKIKIFYGKELVRKPKKFINRNKNTKEKSIW